MKYVLLLLLALFSSANATTIAISVTVVNPLAFAQTTSLMAPVSSGATVGIISGGTAPYSVADTVHFSVSGSSLKAATTLAAGQYPTTISDSGAQQLQVNVSVGVANPVVFTAAKILVAPVGTGTIVGTISGGVTPYVVNDTTDFSVSGSNLLAAKTLVAASYPITITDNVGTTTSPTVVVVTVLGFAQTEPLTAPVSSGTTVGVISGGTSPYTVADTTDFTVSGSNLNAARTLVAGAYPTTLNDSNGQSLNITVTASSPVTFTQVVPLAAPVASGTLIGTIAGGTAPYSVNDTADFSVSSGNLLAAKTLAAGSFPIIVSDSASGSVHATVVISSGIAFAQTIPLVAPVPATTVVGTIAGGVTPYAVADTTHFVVVNTTHLAAAESLAAGQYATTISDSSGQTQAITVSVETPVVVTQSTTITSAIVTGTGVATISGGVGPYVVNDTTDFTVSGANLYLAKILTAGNYPVTVTDSLGAMGSATFTVYTPLAVQVSSNLVGPVAQGTTVATISGGFGPYSINDTTDFVVNGSNVQTAQVLGANNYSVIISDSASPHVLTAAVTIPVQTAAPPITFAPTGVSAPVQIGTSVGTISGGTPPYFVNDTVNFVVSGSNLNAARVLSAGSYPITLTDSGTGSLTTTISIVTKSTAVACNQIGALTAPLPPGTVICVIQVSPPTWTAPPGIFNLSGPDAGSFNTNGYNFANSITLQAGVYTVILTSTP